MRMVKGFLFRRILMPCREVTTKQLITACCAGVIGGVFPVPMLTSIATLIICSLLRCRALEVTLATSINLLLAPLELLLVVPFAWVTATIIGADANQFTTTALYQSTRLGFVDFIRSSASLLVYSCTSWFLITVPLLFLIRGVQRKWEKNKCV